MLNDEELKEVLEQDWEIKTTIFRPIERFSVSFNTGGRLPYVIITKNTKDRVCYVLNHLYSIYIRRVTLRFCALQGIYAL